MTRFLIGLIKGYQRFISPLFPPSCRYRPTCSSYTIQAIERFGGLRGVTMGFFRVLRCHPFAKGGYDPVPEHFTLKRQDPFV